MDGLLSFKELTIDWKFELFDQKADVSFGVYKDKLYTNTFGKVIELDKKLLIKQIKIVQGYVMWLKHATIQIRTKAKMQENCNLWWKSWYQYLCRSHSFGLRMTMADDDLADDERYKDRAGVGKDILTKVIGQDRANKKTQNEILLYHFDLYSF